MKIDRPAFLMLPITIVLMTILYGGVHQPVLACFYLCELITVAFWAFDALRRGEIPLSRSLLQVPLVALGLFGLIQIVPFGSLADPSGIAGIPRTISADPYATRLTVVQIGCYAIFFAVALGYVASARRLARLAAFVTIFGSVYAFFAILQSVLSPEAIYGIYKPLAARPFGTFVNRNDFAAMMLMLAAVPLGLVFSGSVLNDRRLLYVVAIALMGTSILLSQSRGGLVAFVGEIILLVIFTSRVHGRKKLILKAGLSIAFLLAAVGGAVFVGGDTSLVRFSGDAISGDVATESTSRFHIWGITTKIAAANLSFGIGLGAFPVVYPQFETSDSSPAVEQAHNDYLQLLSDAGIVGGAIGVLFILIWIRQSRASLKVRNKLRHGIAAGCVAGTAAVLLQSAFDFALHITAVALLFLLLLSMLAASERKYEDDEDDPDPKEHRRKGDVSSMRQPVSARRAV